MVQNKTPETSAAAIYPTDGTQAIEPALSNIDPFEGSLVQERIDALMRDDSSEQINYGSLIVGAVGPHRPVYMDSNEATPVMFDDPEAYRVLIAAVKQFYVRTGGKRGHNEKTLLNAAVKGINLGVINYFGNIIPPIDEQNKRSAKLTAICGESKLSVCGLKGMAMCGERAILAHNAFKILGLKSVVKMGMLDTVDLSGHTIKSEHHQYIVLTNSEGEEYIYDPMNTTIVRFERDPSEIDAQPKLTKITQSRDVTTTWVEIVVHTDGTREEITKGQMVYRGDFANSYLARTAINEL